MEGWLAELLKRQGGLTLTSVQEAAVSAGVAVGRSMVVCAPTSSGKTFVGEIAILAGLRAKCSGLYLVSHKALADQKFDDFMQKYGARGSRPIARIGVSTGDREEGDDDPQIVIATYEKALSLVMGGAVDVGNTVIVADELQLIGEPKRGPDVEILCAALRRREPRQFVALTATIENVSDFSGWLECELVHSKIRDVELVQEIWAHDATYSVTFGSDTGKTQKQKQGRSLDTLSVLESLLSNGRGPVLVFVETRQDAMNLAETFASRRSKSPDGYTFAEQLSLFSEATEFSDRLRQAAETKVIFHTADLTPSERAVVERGLVVGNFEAVFATPTLAAGVNFPFQTVLFDRIRRRYIQPPLLPLGAYRNMSGRAGRLGMHDKGFSVIVPRDTEEREHANKLVTPENERLFSQLASMSIRKMALSLVASATANSTSSIRDFFEHTLFWYQVRDRNPVRLDELVEKLGDAVAWLLENGFLVDARGSLEATDLGKITARTGLLPTTARGFADLLNENRDALESQFDEHELPLIHAACWSDEFNSDAAQRFLPTVPRNFDAHELQQVLRDVPLFRQQQSVPRQANNAAFATYLFAMGEAERRIAPRSGIPSGQVHRLAGEIAWILDGLHRIAGVATLGCSQQLMNRIGLLAKRVRVGVPAEAIDLVRTAQAAGVPGFGRQRALTLLKAKLADRESLLSADRGVLLKLLSSKERVDRLIEAIERQTPSEFERARRLHLRIAEKVGIEPQVRDAYDKLGEDYDRAIEVLLRLEAEWSVTRLDNGKRQGAPDLMIQYQGKALVLECKTTTKKPPAINKEEAFAVLIKATDISGVHCVTVGKPGFDTFSESKACGSSEITLINHATFVAATLLRRQAKISLTDLFKWLCEPGVAELDRLGLLTE